jgi:ElaA protein
MYKKTFHDLSVDELYQILKLRSEVFIMEQTCLYQDIDNLDQQSIHFFMKDQDTITCYLRVILSDIPRIGRVVVPKIHRNKGYASLLLKEAIIYIFQTLQKDTIVLSAQVAVQGVYQKVGFEAVGDCYLEDDIPHIKMILKKDE